LEGRKIFLYRQPPKQPSCPGQKARKNEPSGIHQLSPDEPNRVVGKKTKRRPLTRRSSRRKILSKNARTHITTQYSQLLAMKFLALMTLFPVAICTLTNCVSDGYTSRLTQEAKDMSENSPVIGTTLGTAGLLVENKVSVPL